MPPSLDPPDPDPTLVSINTPKPRRNARRLLKRCVVPLLAFLIVWFSAKTWSVVRAPLVREGSPLVINDVSQLNPRAPEFLALKRQLDPTNKFRSKLLDKYLRPR